MSIKIKLSVIIIVIIAVFTGGIAYILLARASNISRNSGVRSLEYLSAVQAEYWKGREESLFKVIRTMANVMGDYEDVPAAERRNRFDDMLRSVTAAETTVYQVYTVWKPNAVDGMDARYRGRFGSTSTGQYAAVFVRENGRITSRITGDVDDALAYIYGPDARKDRYEHPVPVKTDGKDTYSFRLTVPVINKRTDEVVGAVGCLCGIEPMQPALENTIKYNEEVYAAAVYSSNGFIMASYMPDRIGRNMKDVDIIYGDYLQEALEAVRTGREFMCRSYSPILKSNMEIYIKPLPIGDSGETWSIMTASTDAYILKDVNAMSAFAVILVTMAVIWAAALVFAVISKILS